MSEAETSAVFAETEEGSSYEDGQVNFDFDGVEPVLMWYSEFEMAKAIDHASAKPVMENAAYGVKESEEKMKEMI